MKSIYKLALSIVLLSPVSVQSQSVINAPDKAVLQQVRDRLPEDEVIYFLLPDRFENGDLKNDRGGIKGDRLKTGYHPAHKGFFHGGDLKGLMNRLGYIQSLGVTAIWLSPIFKNRAVQGGKGQESAGYHGYWVTDFTTVDPHLGTEEDFRNLVNAAHARGMKIYMDIITNHTADVISYKECPITACKYRNRADYPYSRRASDGAQINIGFAGDKEISHENFSKLTDMNFAYTPYVSKSDLNAKVPAWLNDISLYHNRGDSAFRGESSDMGDFVGLDDLMTENPKVVQGFIDIYGAWIDKYGIDGFRIDTVKHVNPEFWQKFAPAMVERAKAKGIPNFHVFAEVATDNMDTALLARWTQNAKLPSVLDFAFGRAIVDMVAGKSGTEQLERLVADDVLYAGAAKRMPTFLGNHDVGRFAWFIRKLNPGASDEEVLKRVNLGYALMLTSRGVPTIYSGDEQGFAGDGIDQDAREDMFASKVNVYNDNKLVGTSRTTAQPNFHKDHPIFQTIAKIAELRRNHVSLRRGRQLIRSYSEKPGLIAFSRIDGETGRDVMMIANTSNEQLTANFEVDARATEIVTLSGSCPKNIVSAGSAKIELAPLEFAICEVK
jgi:neopullulanase